MEIKTSKLLFLLALTVFAGHLKLEESREKKPLSNYNDFSIYIKSQSTPYYIEPEVNGTIINDYYSLIAQYNWDAKIAYAILQAESKKDPEAENLKDHHKGCIGSFGLFQIGCIHIGKYGLTKENIKDPEKNIKVAYSLYKDYGWKIWGAYTDESYLDFL